MGATTKNCEREREVDLSQDSGINPFVWNVETLLQRLSCAEVIFVKCERKQNNIIKPSSFLPFLMIKIIVIIHTKTSLQPTTSAPCC